MEIRILNADVEPTAVNRRGRRRLYDQAVEQAVVTMWEAADRVCGGQRLKALLPNSARPKCKA